MRALEFITGHVIDNLAYTYKFQLKTTMVSVLLCITAEVKYIFEDRKCFIEKAGDKTFCAESASKLFLRMQF